MAVLVTDGTPTQCDTSEDHLVALIADGHTKGVDTFTLGLSGADIDVLDRYATAGGTNRAIDVSAGAGVRGRVERDPCARHGAGRDSLTNRPALASAASVRRPLHRCQTSSGAIDA